jgi:hypothetical protein
MVRTVEPSEKSYIGLDFDRSNAAALQMTFVLKTNFWEVDPYSQDIYMGDRER